jgi:hypothetical protein
VLLLGGRTVPPRDDSHWLSDPAVGIGKISHVRDRRRLDPPAEVVATWAGGGVET